MSKTKEQIETLDKFLKHSNLNTAIEDARNLTIVEQDDSDFISEVKRKLMLHLPDK
jgi:hypothetical protein